MSEAEAAAIQHAAWSCRTRYPRDLAQQALIIRGASDRSYALRVILDARREWVDWLARGQRRWQSCNTRRPSRARHHDSIEIREKYVRCLG